MELKELEDSELVRMQLAVEQERKRREDIKKEARKKVREALNQAIIDNVDAFLLICPNHQMSSCSDSSPKNADRGCARCILIDAKVSGYINDAFKPDLTFYKED